MFPEVRCDEPGRRAGPVPEPLPGTVDLGLDLVDDFADDVADDFAVDIESDPTPVVDLGRAPGAVLALECQTAAAIPELLTDAQILDVVEGTEALLRWATGVRTRMLAAFADRHPKGSSAAPPGADPSCATPVSRWLPDEVGLTLGISRLEALGQVVQATRFAHVLPDTLDALEHGRIDIRRAEAIAQPTMVLPDDKARAVEAAVLPAAPDATLRQLRDRVRRAIARIDPDGEYRRHREANIQRRVSIRSLDDGMASLWFYGPAEQVEAAWQMADRLARSLCPEDPRTLDQRRFDLAVQILQGRLTVTDMSDVKGLVGDLLLGSAATGPVTSGSAATEPAVTDQKADGAATGPHVEATDPAGERAGPAPPVPPDALADAVVRALAMRPDPSCTVHKPLVQVVVGLDTLLGDDRPAELVGHGPVAASTARALAADGVWRRLVTDPLSGALLDHGRTTYTPPVGLADHVRARDQVCRGPHCTRRIRDLDHHVSWGRNERGHTAEPNLFGYCLHHHQLKDAPGWHVLAHPDRSLTWVSPHGRRTTTQPFDYRPFTDDPPAPVGSTDTSAVTWAAPVPGPHDGDADPPPF